MDAHKFSTIALILAFSGVALAQPGKRSEPPSLSSPVSDHERLIGAWHLVSIGSTGQGSTDKGPATTPATEIKGALVYTRDGHMSVQLMYPPAAAALSNDYVLNGYEASFGSYDVNEATHTVTHHIQGSVTRALVGKDLPRAYHFSDGNLIIQSTRPDEHWSVIWQHD